MNLYRKLAYTTFLVASLIAFSKWLFVSGYEYIGGNGDFATMVQMDEILKIQSSVVSDLHGAGQLRAFIVATIVPVSLIFSFFNLIGFSIFHSVILYSVFFHFISSITMYELLIYLSKKVPNFSNETCVNFIAIFYAIFYSLAPFFSQFYLPGHFTVLISGSLFPLVFLLMDKFFSQTKFSWKYPLFLFITFFLMSSAFTNFGYYLVYLIILGLYFIVTLFTNLSSYKRLVPKILLTLTIFIMSAFWWLSGTAFYFAKSFNQQSTYSQDTIGGSLNIAVATSQIYNTILGLANFEPAGLLYYLHIVLYIAILVPFIYFISRNSKFSAVYLALVLISVFIVTATNPPFTNLFKYLYENVPGFQLFRRPYSKIYWPYLFGLCVLSYLGLICFMPKVKTALRNFIYVSLVFASLVFVFEFRQGTDFVPFNVPKEFTDLKNYLTDNNVSRILMLPNIKNKPPFYDESLNKVGGVSLEPTILNIQALSYDTENIFSLNDPMLDNLDDLYKKLITESPLACNNFKDLGISHVVLRKNIINKEVRHKIPFVEEKLDNSEVLINKKIIKGDLSDGFVVYSVVDNCMSPLIGTSVENVFVSSEKINPAAYKVKVRSEIQNQKLNIFFLNNYDYDFVLYSPGEKLIIRPTSYLGYANQYYIELNHSGQVYYLVHLWQLVLYISFSLTLLTFFVLLVMYLRERKHVL